MRSQWMLLLLAGSALPALFAQAEKGPAKQVNSAKQVNNTKQSAIKPIPAADWPLYSHDLACTRYSSLNQISAANVSQLALAWNYKPSAPPPSPDADKAAPKGKGKRGRRRRISRSHADCGKRRYVSARWQPRVRARGGYRQGDLDVHCPGSCGQSSRRLLARRSKQSSARSIHYWPQHDGSER
jgi:hypothetical protein